MTNEERIIAMLERIHHENCFLLTAMSNMVAHDEEITEKIEGIVEDWDNNIKAIMKGDEEDV